MAGQEDPVVAQQMMDLLMSLKTTVERFTHAVDNDARRRERASQAMTDEQREAHKQRQEQIKQMSLYTELQRTQLNAGLNAVYTSQMRQNSDDIKAHFARLEKLSSRQTDRRLDIDRSNSRYDLAVDYLKNNPVSRFTGIIGDQSKSTQKLDQGVGVTSGLQSLKNSALQGVPFGGLIGLMMYGAFKDEEWRAEGTKAARVFEGLSNVTQGQIAQLTRSLRSMSVTGRATTEDFKANFTTMAQAGYDWSTAMQRAEFAVQDASNSSKTAMQELHITAMALDKGFSQAAGSSMKFAVAAAVNSNQGPREMLTVAKDLAMAAKNIGVNFGTAMNVISQSGSAMRLQAQDAKELGDYLARFSSGLQKMRGMTAQRAGLLAGEGLQSLAGGLGGASRPWAAFLGAEMAKREGRNVGAEQGYVEYRTGASASDGSFMGRVLPILKDIVNRVSPDDSSKRLIAMEGILRQLGVGDPFKTAEIVMSMDENTNLAKMSQKQLDQLNQAFSKSASEESEFTRLLRQLQDTVAMLGRGLLETAVGSLKGLKALLDAVMVGYALQAEVLQYLMPTKGMKQAYQENFLGKMFERFYVKRDGKFVRDESGNLAHGASFWNIGKGADQQVLKGFNTTIESLEKILKILNRGAERVGEAGGAGKPTGKKTAYIELNDGSKVALNIGFTVDAARIEGSA